MNWEKVAIGSVAEILPGFAFKSVELGDQGTAVLKIGNINDDGTVNTNKAQRLAQQHQSERHLKYELGDRDIIIAMTGATAGKAGRIRSSEGETFLLNQRVAKFCPRTVDPDYLWFVVSTDAYRNLFYGLGGGAAQPNMSGPQIASVQIPLPPVDAQRRISDILSAYDDLIENNRRRIVLLEEAARQLYKEWFVRFRFPGHEHVKIIDGVPEGWERMPASKVLNVLSGGTPKTHTPQFWDGDIGFFTPKDAVQGTYVSGTEKTITEEGLAKCNSKLYPKDTLFITARGTVGKMNLALVPMAMNQSCYALVSNSWLSQRMLYLTMDASLQQFRSQASGAVFDAIVVATFDRISVTKPEAKIADMFDDLLDPVFDQIANLGKQVEQLTKARDLLLPKLLSGAIAV